MCEADVTRSGRGGCVLSGLVGSTVLCDWPPRRHGRELTSAKLPSNFSLKQEQLDLEGY
jgi:hypothetical protein